MSKYQEKWMKKVMRVWPVAKGSLREVTKTCSRKNCQACLSGEKHLSWLFTYYVDGKQRCKYVPKDKVKTMQEALINGRKLEQLILESGLEILKKRKTSSSK